MQRTCIGCLLAVAVTPAAAPNKKAVREVDSPVMPPASVSCLVGRVWRVKRQPDPTSLGIVK